MTALNSGDMYNRKTGKDGACEILGHDQYGNYFHMRAYRNDAYKSWDMCFVVNKDRTFGMPESCDGVKDFIMFKDVDAQLPVFATGLPEHLSRTQYELVYDATSFGMASMMAATLFFWLRVSAIAPQHQSALVITGLVTFIASYHVSTEVESFKTEDTD